MFNVRKTRISSDINWQFYFGVSEKLRVLNYSNLKFSEFSGIAGVNETVLITLEENFKPGMILDNWVGWGVVLITTRLFSSTPTTDALVGQQYSCHARIPVLALERDDLKIWKISRRSGYIEHEPPSISTTTKTWSPYVTLHPYDPWHMGVSWSVFVAVRLPSHAWQCL